MARMIPELSEQEIIGTQGSSAEARVYAALRDGLPKRITVLYSVPWTDKIGKRAAYNGESDFVVIDPDRGLLVLEVKGGTVEVSTGGRWFTRVAGNLTGITNPFTQGVTSENVLKRAVLEVLGDSGNSLVFGHGVVLPDMLAGPGNLGLDAPSEIIVVGSHLDNLGDSVRAVFDFWSHGSFVKTEQSDVDRIVDHIFPQKVLAPPLGTMVRDAESKIITLTYRQMAILSFVGAHRRVCIEGPAGTGKTVIAFEKARQLAASGNRTLFTCFNKRLANTLASLAEGTPNLSVRTFHDTCWWLAELAGLKLPSKGSNLSAEFFDATLLDMMLKALDLLPGERFDAIVADEAQDLKSEWWDLLELLMADSETGWLWAFRDPQQALYQRDATLPAGMLSFPLVENIRNASLIHDEAARYVADAGTCRVTEPGEVKFVHAPDKRAVRVALGKELHRLINVEQVNRDDVVVLTSTALTKSSVANLPQVGSFKLRASDVEGDGIEVETIWRFKGLERPVVIMLDVDESTTAALRYVGMTRARAVLVMIGK